jgi:hypothetical protein
VESGANVGRADDLGEKVNEDFALLKREMQKLERR